MSTSTRGVRSWDAQYPDRGFRRFIPYVMPGPGAVPSLGHALDIVDRLRWTLTVEGEPDRVHRLEACANRYVRRRNWYSEQKGMRVVREPYPSAAGKDLTYCKEQLCPFCGSYRPRDRRRRTERVLSKNDMLYKKARYLITFHCSRSAGEPLADMERLLTRAVRDFFLDERIRSRVEGGLIAVDVAHHSFPNKRDRPQAESRRPSPHHHGIIDGTRIPKHLGTVVFCEKLAALGGPAGTVHVRQLRQPRDVHRTLGYVLKTHARQTTNTGAYALAEMNEFWRGLKISNWRFGSWIDQSPSELPHDDNEPGPVRVRRWKKAG